MYNVLTRAVKLCFLELLNDTFVLGEGSTEPICNAQSLHRVPFLIELFERCSKSLIEDLIAGARLANITLTDYSKYFEISQRFPNSLYAEPCIEAEEREAYEAGTYIIKMSQRIEDVSLALCKQELKVYRTYHV